MTLARASSADSNTQPVEVETVQQVLSEETGETVSAVNIRVAASSEIFERASLEKYLVRVAPELTSQDRLRVARGLARVIKSDVRITEQEAAFFNKADGALGVTAAELAGLVD